MLKNNKMVIAILLMTSLVILVGQGCQPAKQQSGIHVMFAENPHIKAEKVYWHSQTIGSITGSQVGNNGITKVTVRLDPRFIDQAGHNWAFFVARGRLNAERLSITGEAVTAGDAVCGFSSKGALNWFKVKTILKNRVSNAMRRADSLQRRFG